MKQLNEYSHNLTGKEIIYDDGNWTRQGKWHEDIYKVHEDGSVRQVRRQKYWTNVVGESEPAKGQSFVPECDGKSIYINGTRCKLPVKAEFELRPQHTCEAPCFHTYTYTVEGNTYTERFGFCDPSQADRKWKDYITQYPQYTFDLLSVERTV